MTTQVPQSLLRPPEVLQDTSAYQSGDDIDGASSATESLSDDESPDDDSPGPGTPMDTWAYLKKCKELNIIPVSRLVERSDSENIYLKHYGLGVKGAIALAECLKVNNTMQYLNLGDNWVCEEGSVHIADALKVNKSILGLDLSDNYVAGRGGRAVAEVLDDPNVRLMELSMRGNKLGDKESSSLFGALASNTRLTSIDISCNEFGEKAGAAIGDMLARNTTLVDMDLSWNSLRLSGAVKIALGLAQNISVKKFSIGWNGLGDEGGQQLGDAIATNQVLRFLDIQHNRLTMDSCQALADGIRQNCGSLIDLNLAHNPLGDLGARLILDAVRENKYITNVDMTNTRASEETLIELEELLRQRRAMSVMVKAQRDAAQGHNKQVKGEMTAPPGMSKEEAERWRIQNDRTFITNMPTDVD